LWFWAEVTTENPIVDRTFQIFGTGQEIPLNATYVGTVVGPPLVWHLYELLIA
jgi:hypothetical protein